MSESRIDRVVLITGAAGGIGRATARVFEENGWSVIGVDRRHPDMPFTAPHSFLLADVSDPGTDALINQHLDEHSINRVDTIVNNAAMQVTKSFMDTSLDEWDMVMTSNVRSVLLTVQAVGRRLARNGAIVNVSSVHAIATSRGIAAYAASKGALLALTRAMALEFAAENVRVNAILPGAVDTHMLRAGLGRRPEDGETEEAALRTLGSRTPLGRVGEPQEIGRAIFFLADQEQSSFMTGQAMIVDGGATTKLGTE